MRFKIFSLFLLMVQFSCSETTNSNAQDTSSSENQEVINDNSESDKKKNIIFFGDSLTAGYGLDDPSSDGYTALIQNRLDSLNHNYKVINAGVSGETTAGGNERVNWILRQPVDIFVLELGGNDGLRGIDPVSSKQNLQSIIDKVRAKYSNTKIILAGMEAPPNMGEKFTAEFRSMYPDLAEKNKTALIPFFLENIGGIPSLNQKDGIHPNVEGHKVLVENVWNVLKELL